MVNRLMNLLSNVQLDRATIDRINRVYEVANRFGERGVMSWAERAAADAAALNKLRERDERTLNRLEDTFNHDFYRDNGGKFSPVYA